MYFISSPHTHEIACISVLVIVILKLASSSSCQETCLGVQLDLSTGLVLVMRVKECEDEEEGSSFFKQIPGTPSGPGAASLERSLRVSSTSL